MSSILSRNYFKLDKKQFSESELSSVRSDLTVKPFVNSDYDLADDGDTGEFKVYNESKNTLRIPRFYGLERYGKADIVKTYEYKKLDHLKFALPLRELQINATNACLEVLKNKGGCLLCARCGQGKTCCGLYLWTQLKVPLLIIVHKDFLLEQWKKSIKKFVPDVSVGLIQSKTTDYKDKDVVIGMLQSISKDKYSKDIYDQFGMVIVDECFPYDTLITTDCGIYKIGDLYNRWVSEEGQPRILSYNIDQKKFEYNLMEYGWKKESSGLITVEMGNRSITCTPNHKVLTKNGYVMAKLLQVGDLVITRCDPSNVDKYTAIGLNDDQLQIVYGLILSGSFKKLGNGRCSVDTDILIEGNGWLTDVFRYNGRYDKGKRHFWTNPIDMDISMEEIMDKIDGRGLSVWYSNSEPEIPTKYALLIHNKLKTCYGIDCDYDNNNIYFTDEQNFNKFNETINIRYEWNNKFLDHGTVIVTKIFKEHVVKKLDVYDICVANNHNYIIANRNYDKNGIVVSNCHRIGSKCFSRALPIISTKYMLGLTATPERKDRLSKVFKWYLIIENII